VYVGRNVVFLISAFLVVEQFDTNLKSPVVGCKKFFAPNYEQLLCTLHQIFGHAVCMEEVRNAYTDGVRKSEKISWEA
jgi:hypothetical protein